jgi:hypothetical protein
LFLTSAANTFFVVVNYLTHFVPCGIPKRQFVNLSCKRLIGVVADSVKLQLKVREQPTSLYESPIANPQVVYPFLDMTTLEADAMVKPVN